MAIAVIVPVSTLLAGILLMPPEQLYLALLVPIAVNAMFFTILALYINAKIAGLEGKMDARFDGLTQNMEIRFKHLEEQR
jgi:hypothetical protein